MDEKDTLQSGAGFEAAGEASAQAPMPPKQAPRIRAARVKGGSDSGARRKRPRTRRCGSEAGEASAPKARGEAARSVSFLMQLQRGLNRSETRVPGQKKKPTRETRVGCNKGY